MPWPAFRHRVADPRARVCDDTLLDRAADAHTVEVQRGDLLGRMPAQVLIVRALHHAVQCLVRFAQPLLGQPLVLGHATLRPTVGAFHRGFLIRARVHQRRQFVEREHDVRADFMLDAHRDFRGETMTVAVERRFECHPILVDERQSFLARRDHVVRFHAGHVHRQRLLESGTWNPPESVNVGPSQFMNRASPPAASSTSWPGRSNR